MRWFLLTFPQRLPRGHRSTPVRVTLWLSTDVERVAAAGLLAVQAFGARALSQLRSARRHVRCLMPTISAAALTPWSATCYPTRSAERGSSAQAKYGRREGAHFFLRKIRGARGVRLASRASHCPTHSRALAFIGR